MNNSFEEELDRLLEGHPEDVQELCKISKEYYHHIKILFSNLFSELNNSEVGKNLSKKILSDVDGYFAEIKFKNHSKSIICKINSSSKVWILEPYGGKKYLSVKSNSYKLDDIKAVVDEVLNYFMASYKYLNHLGVENSDKTLRRLSFRDKLDNKLSEEILNIVPQDILSVFGDLLKQDLCDVCGNAKCTCNKSSDNYLEPVDSEKETNKLKPAGLGKLSIEADVGDIDKIEKFFKSCIDLNGMDLIAPVFQNHSVIKISRVE